MHFKKNYRQLNFYINKIKHTDSGVSLSSPKLVDRDSARKTTLIFGQTVALHMRITTEEVIQLMYLPTRHYR